MEKKKNHKLVGLEKRKAIAGYCFIAPFIVGFLVFMIKPFFQSLYMSFTNVDLRAGNFSMSWCGIENYFFAIRKDASYVRLLTEELLRMVVYSFAIIVFSFFVSLILNQKFHGRALVRAVFFLPVILSSKHAPCDCAQSSTSLKSCFLHRSTILSILAACPYK